MPFIDSQSLDISCPGTVQVMQFAATTGKASYRLVNDTGADVFFNILVQLTDTADNRREFSQSIQVVQANSTFLDSHTLVINTNYATPGRITATLNVQIQGAASFSDSVICNFDVV